MIGALVTVISLNLSLALIQGGQVAGTFPITGATATTPIVVTSPAHNVPSGRVVHGVVSGVFGTEADGLWVMYPTDADHFALYSFTAQGIKTPSVGTVPYAGGGLIQFAFPEWGILLGRRNVQLSSAVASPRVVFVPTTARAVGFQPIVAQGQAYKSLGTLEQQSMKEVSQAATDFTTFEVFITGAATPPSPDFGDFDATQLLGWALYNVLWDMVGDAVDVKRVDWPSQAVDSGTQTQRGQQVRWVIELQQPIVYNPLQFVPAGTKLTLTVEPVNPGSTDPQIIVIT